MNNLTSSSTLIVLDTETAGSLQSPLIYDFGFVVVKDNKIVDRFNYINKSIYNKVKSGKVSAYYASKIESFYSKAIQENPSIVKNWNYIMKVFNNVIHREMAMGNNVILSAYNIGFDMKAIDATARYTRNGKNLDVIPQIIDIMQIAISTIGQSKKYRKSAPLTDKGNIQSGAEAMYSYITKNPNYIESHTALDDCLIELDILRHCMRYYRKDFNSYIDNVKNLSRTMWLK